MFSAADTVVVKQVIDGIKQGIDAMTPAAKHLYELAIRQIQIEATIGLTFAWGLVILIVLMWLNVSNIRHSKNYSYSTDENWTVAAWITSIVGGIAAFLLFLTYTAAYMNPEWKAIEMLRGLI